MFWKVDQTLPAGQRMEAAPAVSRICQNIYCCSKKADQLLDSCPQTVPQIGKRDELMYNPIRVNDITWNFEKFLIDSEGRPRFRSTRPLGPTAKLCRNSPTNWCQSKSKKCREK
ncbi:hypothetical protein GPALN_009676 [Globodera pallida]|nr:hypothetical protein GPALN_009676 [Globodera pallida]